MVTASRAMQRISSQLTGSHTPTWAKLTALSAATPEASKPMALMYWATLKTALAAGSVM